MAWFETWIKNDLAKPINVVQLQGVMFNLDNLANKIGVELEYNGQPAALEGTIAGYVIKNDGTTLNLTANTGKDGNKAWVILPQEAYTVEGPISIVIKLVYNSAETTIGACAGYVTRSRTSSEIAPTGTVIPSLASLEAAIAAANAAAANAAGAADYIAPTEEDSTASAAHAVGSYFIYNGKLMNATSAIAQGATIVPYASGVTNYNCAEVPNGLSGAVYNVNNTANAAANNAADAQRLVAPVESFAGMPTGVATMAHATGSYFVFGGVLYRATSDIAIGDTITTTGASANCEAVPGGLGGEVSELKSAFRSEIIYKDTSVYALEWRKGSAINTLGRYASSHPEAVSLLGGDRCPYVYAGTTFTVGSGYTVSMSLWSEPLTGSINASKRLYLVRNVEAGTVTAPVDGYIGLSIAKADGTSISDDVLAEDFANTAVTSCEIYSRTVKTEITDADARIDALYATTNDASIWSSGKWAVGNGAASTDTKVIKSAKYIPTDYMHEALGIIACTGYEFSVLCWALDGTYKGSWTGSGFSTSSNTYFTRLMFSEITSGHKYALNVQAKDGSVITTSAYTNISFIVPTCYKKVDTDQGLANAGKTLMVGDDGKVAPKRQGIDYHTDLINAQRGIAVDWHLPFIDLADEMMLGANHQIPGTATLWSDTGTTDLVQKNVWMSDGTHPYRGVGLVDMYGRAIANRMALITPSYHDGAGESTPSYWAGKRFLWMGTSIPAGSDPEAGDGVGATYPSLVATQLGANVTNIAKGSSMLRIASSTGAWNGVAYSHFLRAVTRMTAEADALAADWANIYASIPNAPSALPSADLQTMKTLSFESLLLPYLDGANTAPDAIVIDYGHNDIATGIDGNRDFWVRPTQESIASGLLAEDTWMTANNYANLKLALNNDLSGITDLPAFAASLNRNCFIGAANFLITVILRYKPYMRIIFVSDYN